MRKILKAIYKKELSKEQTYYGFGNVLGNTFFVLHGLEESDVTSLKVGVHRLKEQTILDFIGESENGYRNELVLDLDDAKRILKGFKAVYSGSKCGKLVSINKEGFFTNAACISYQFLYSIETNFGKGGSPVLNFQLRYLEMVIKIAKKLKKQSIRILSTFDESYIGNVHLKIGNVTLTIPNLENA